MTQGLVDACLCTTDGDNTGLTRDSSLLKCAAAEGWRLVPKPHCPLGPIRPLHTGYHSHQAGVPEEHETPRVYNRVKPMHTLWCPLWRSG